MVDIAGWTFFGCLFLGGLWLAWMVAEDSRIGGAVLAIAVVSLFSFMGLCIYDEVYGNHPTFELRKDRWTCTARHTEVTVTMVGKVATTTNHVVCDQYTRN